MLTRIQLTRCPGCGAPAAEESRRDPVDDVWHENRTFKCGLSLQYSPLFNFITEVTKCRRSAENLREHAERSALLAQLQQNVNSAAVTDEFKQVLSRSLLAAASTLVSPVPN